MIKNRERQTRTPKGRAEIIQNFQKGQNTQFQTDKSDPESFQLMRNMYHEGGNAKMRNGFSVFKEIKDGDDSIVQDIAIYDKSADNGLIVAIDDGANTKIQEINRDTGTTADLITGLIGQGDLSATSLKGSLFTCNAGSTNVHYYDGTISGTFSMDFGGGAVPSKLLASDGTRLWGVSQELPTEILGFTNVGAVGSLTFNAGASTNIARAGVAGSKITKFTALMGIGKFIFACGKERVELLSIPDFAKNGVTIFAADINLVLKSWENIGVENSKAIVGTRDFAFLIGNDGILHRISTSGTLKSYKTLERDMRDYDFTDASIGYDQGRDLIYISCKKLSDYDTIIVFNVEEENFAIFDNIYGQAWAFDKDNVYFLNIAGQICDGFVAGSWTDRGLEIEWEILTQGNYSGSLEFYKKARETFIHTLVGEQVPIKLDFIADRGVDSPITADKTIERTHSFVVNPFTDVPQHLGQGNFGGAQVNYQADQKTEQIYNSDKINRRYERYELRATGKAKNSFEIKGIGLKYVQTDKKVKELIFN